MKSLLILLASAGFCFGQVQLTASNSADEGGNSEAQWRKEALARIEKIRKARLTVQVVNTQGKPIPGAKVHVQQQRHLFGFGNILNPRTFQLEGKDGRMYRRIFAEHFNKTTFESGFRWQNWYRPAREGKLDEHKKLLDSMIDFCQSHKIGDRFLPIPQDRHSRPLPLLGAAQP
ncbi:MAG: hypothetical protein ACYS32_17990 [Planctomycetota bacterium]|jgi:hypothetical protein